MVKCLVCGAIFDSSLEVCPVCGVGKENFVPVEEQENTFQNNTDEYYVIIGNGTAGFHAAQAIRERDKTGAVLMISDEPYAAYNRPMLTKSIADGADADKIAIEPDAWYKENQVYQILGNRAESVDTEAGEVHLAGGETIHFTRLIYAAGSECFIPPIEGSGKKEVVAIRKINDVKKLRGLMENAEHAVVIGGGVLGLEAAWEVKKAGIRVNVLEAAPVLMGRQLDEDSADFLRRIAEKNDIRIRTGAAVTAIEGDGKVTGARLADGECIPADLVIISAGVRANIALAKTMGLETERAVKVNSRMETSAPHIYACGDCAEYEGVNYAVWPEATEQGKIAGANAAGEALEYRQITAALTFNGMNTSLFAAGDTGKGQGVSYKIREERSEEKGYLKKYFYREEMLVGAILIGDISEMGKVTEALER